MEIGRGNSLFRCQEERGLKGADDAAAPAPDAAAASVPATLILIHSDLAASEKSSYTDKAEGAGAGGRGYGSSAGGAELILEEVGLSPEEMNEGFESSKVWKQTDAGGWWEWGCRGGGRRRWSCDTERDGSILAPRKPLPSPKKLKELQELKQMHELKQLQERFLGELAEEAASSSSAPPAPPAPPAATSSAKKRPGTEPDDRSTKQLRLRRRADKIEVLPAECLKIGGVLGRAATTPAFSRA